MSDKKEEKVEEKVENKKEKAKKEKKPKKEKIPFDKIDITTATEDQIIESGKWHNTKADYICYLVMFGIFILMLVPPVLRTVIPKPITEEDRVIVYADVKCYRNKVVDNREISTTLTFRYRDSSIEKLEIKHTVASSGEGETEENITFSEIEDLKNLNLEGITSKFGENDYTFNFDFYNYPDLKNSEVLENYTFEPFGVEINQLKSLDYYCSSNSYEKEERVYIHTGKRVYEEEETEEETK